MKKFLSALMVGISVTLCAFSFTACGDNSGDENKTHTTHNWSTTYTQDGDRHYQTCDGCEEKNYAPHDFTNGDCVCGKEKPHSHTWSTTYTEDGDRHYQTCGGCEEKNYAPHDYGTSGVCVCGKQKPETPPETVNVTSVTLNKNELTLEIGGEETLTASVKPDNATDKTVTWESDKPDIASVDDNGKVTAIADGTATITATADGKDDTCTVTVKAKNKYAPIVEALETKTNAKVLTIFEDKYGCLSCVVKDNEKNYIIKGGVSTEINSKNDILNINITEIAKDIETAEFFNDMSIPFGKYTTDNDSEIVQQMIAKLLGDGYNVIYGTISTTHGGSVDAVLGAYTQFDVYALLEKDGEIFEIEYTISVTTELGDIYQTVINSTELNKDKRYKIESEEITNLGIVAANYFAECNK